jgi:hypothetical protein
MVDNLSFIVGAKNGTGFDPQATHLVLGGENGDLRYTMYFYYGSKIIVGGRSMFRQKALDGLRTVVEQMITTMYSRS